MENWNQVAKYEQISATSYGTAIEKMEAYTSGVEAAQNRLTAAMDKLSLKLNATGMLEKLYNGLATLADNALLFAGALAASSVLLNKGMSINLAGGMARKLTSLLGNVGATFSNIGNKNAGFSYLGNTIKNNADLGSGVGLQMVQELYSQSLIRAANALNADEKAIFTSIQSTLLGTSVSDRLAIAKDIQAEALTADSLATVNDSTITQLLTNANLDELKAAMSHTKTLNDNVRSNRDLLLSDKTLTDARREVAAQLLNESKNYKGTVKALGGNLEDSTTRSTKSLALGGLGGIIGGIAGMNSGNRIGELLGGSSGATIGSMVGGIFGGKAFNNLGNGLGTLFSKNQFANLQTSTLADKNLSKDQIKQRGRDLINLKQQEADELLYSYLDEHPFEDVDTEKFLKEHGLDDKSIKQESKLLMKSLSEEADKVGSKSNILLKAFGGWGGIASIVAQIGLSIYNAYLKATEEATKKAQENFKELNEQYNSAMEASVSAEKYDKLAKGVDYLGRNVSLTDDEYSEFLELSNKIAEVFPDLVVRTDEAGNSFVGMGNTVSGVTDKVNELVEALKQDVDVSIFEKATAPLIAIGNWLKIGKVEGNSVFEEAKETAKNKIKDNKVTSSAYNSPIAREEALQDAEAQKESYRKQMEKLEEWGYSHNSVEYQNAKTRFDESSKKLEKLQNDFEAYDKVVKEAHEDLFDYNNSLVAYAATASGINDGYGEFSGLLAQIDSLDDAQKSFVSNMVKIGSQNIAIDDDYEKNILALNQKMADLVEANPIVADIYFGTNDAETMGAADELKKELYPALVAAFGDGGYDKDEEAILIKLGFVIDENGNLQIETAVLAIARQLQEKFGESFNLSGEFSNWVEGLGQKEYGRLTELVNEGWINPNTLDMTAIKNLVGVGYQTNDIDTLNAQKDYYASNFGTIQTEIEDFYRQVAESGEVAKDMVGGQFSYMSDAAREGILKEAEYFAALDKNATNAEDEINKLRASGETMSYAMSGYVETLKSIATVKLGEAFNTADLGVEGIIDNWKELYNVLENVNDTYKAMQDARSEQTSRGGDLSILTTLSLLSANEKYAEALDVTNGKISLKANAEEIMAKIQLEAVKANIEAAIAEKEQLKSTLAAEYVKLAAGETEIEVTNDAITANNAEIESLNALAQAYANTGEWAGYFASQKRLTSLTPGTAEYEAEQKKSQELYNKAVKGTAKSNAKAQQVSTTEVPTITYDEEARKKRMIEIEKQLGSYNEDEGTFAGGTLDKEINTYKAILQDVDDTISSGSSYEAWKKWYPNPDDIKDASDATKELLDAIDALIDKEYEAMKVWNSVTQTKTGDTEYYDKKEASLQNLKKYWQNKMSSATTTADQLAAEKEIMQIEKDLANLDDEEVQDKISVLLLQKASNSALIDAQKELIATSDTEEEYLERVNELNDLYEERLELLKDIADFQKEMADYSLEYLSGTAYSNSTAYDQYAQYKKDAIQDEIDAISDQMALVEKNTIWSTEEKQKKLREYASEQANLYKELASVDVEIVNAKVDEIQRNIDKLEKQKPEEWTSTAQINKYATDTIAELNKQKKLLYNQIQDSEDLTDEEIADLVDQYNNVLVAIHEAEIEQQENLKDFKDKQYSAITGKVEEYKEALQQAIDDIEEAYDKEYNKLRENNEERERAVKLEDLLQAKKSANEEKKKVYREGIGWVYESDRTKQKEAQDALDDFYRQDELDDLESTKDKEVEILQTRIDNWDKYLEALEYQYGEYERIQNDKYLKELLNVETEEGIYNALTTDMEKFVSDQNNNYTTYIGVFTNFLDEYTACLERLAELQQQSLSLLSAASYQMNNASAITVNTSGSSRSYSSNIDDIITFGYDPNYDYQAGINGILNEKGNYDSNGELLYDAKVVLAGYENARNKKIDDLGLDYEKTDLYQSYSGGLEGGPVTYTGLAMLHGSPNSPEYVLNDTQAYTLLRNMATLKLPEYESTLNNNDTGTQYIVLGDVVLENCDDPAQFWNQVTQQMSNRYNVTKNRK